MDLKFQYVIEFTLPGGKKLKVDIEGTDPDDALNELFKVVRAKTVIHSTTKPDNDHNKVAGMGNDLLDILTGKKKPPFGFPFQ